MPTHFCTYVSNINRVNLSELLDYHADQMRMQRLKPSLVVHPWTGRFYDDMSDADADADCRSESDV